MVSKAVIRQSVAGVTAALTTLYCGMAYGWTSPNLERWLNPQGETPMTVAQTSLVVSLFPIANVFTTIPSGLLVNYTGRKLLLYITGPVQILGWLIILYTRSLELLYVARFLHGLTGGVALTVLPLYIAEIADVNVRGFLGTSVLGFFNLGILFEYVLGTFLTYQQLNYANLSVAVIFTVVFFFMPETPYFLVKKNKITSAEESLSWLKGTKDISKVNEELSQIKTSSDESKSSLKELFTSYPVRRATVIMFTFVTCEIVTGFSAIISYASYIFAAAGDSFLTPNQLSIIIGVVLSSGMFVSAPLVDRLGRRFLLMWSILICGVSQGVVSVYFYFKTSTNVDMSQLTWIPASMFSLYFFFNGLGISSLFGVLQGELFPANLRGVSSSLTIQLGEIWTIISVVLYQMVDVTIGIYWNHVFYAIVCLIGFVIIFRVMPETKGLTFDEIQERLDNRKKS